MPITDIEPEQLASALAARLIHDVMGPASGLVSAFDLMADPKAAAMRDEALILAEESARKLVNMLILSRAIYTNGSFSSSADLQGFAESIVAGTRATLDLSVDPAAVTAASGRLTLGLIQLAAAALPMGGAIRVRLGSQKDRLAVEGSATGPRVRADQTMLNGLAGRGPGDGPPHRWSAAYLLGAIARSAGGVIDAAGAEGSFSFRAVIKAEIA